MKKKSHFVQSSIDWTNSHKMTVLSNYFKVRRTDITDWIEILEDLKKEIREAAKKKTKQQRETFISENEMVKNKLTSYMKTKKHITYLLCFYIDALDENIRKDEIKTIKDMIYK